MSADIGPGDWVEAVGMNPALSRGRRIAGVFTLGALYQVEESRVFEPTGELGVIIRDMPRSTHVTGMWNALCFRPIYRPRESLIRDLLEPIKEDA